ncbi:hypothetical protein GEMRC1_011607 [Eukaryota sp. GEM-RC1]
MAFNVCSTWVPHTKSVTCTKFNTPTSLVATSSADASIAVSRISDLSSPQVLFHLRAGDLAVDDPSLYGVNSVDFSPFDNRYLVSGGDDGFVRLWDVEKQSLIAALEGHKSWILSVAFSPSGTLMLSTSADESIRLWDARTSRPVRVLRGHASVISSAVFSADGTLLASAGGDGLVRVWDVLSGTCLQACMYEACPPIGSVTLSRNKAYVLGSFLDDSVRLVNIKNNTVERTYKGHSNSSFLVESQFMSVTTADDSVVSGSEDGRLMVWNVKTEEVRGELQVFDWPLTCF